MYPKKKWTLEVSGKMAVQDDHGLLFKTMKLSLLQLRGKEQEICWLVDKPPCEVHLAKSTNQWVYIIYYDIYFTTLPV